MKNIGKMKVGKWENPEKYPATVHHRYHIIMTDIRTQDCSHSTPLF